MPRITNEKADLLLDQEISVLDHGFIRLLDYMGGDSRVVASARVSYGDGTKSYREDRRLIRYLMRNMHTSPFEQVEFSFHIKAPIFIARQWFRHRTANVNEYSGRYSVMPNEFYVPETAFIGGQDLKNRQARLFGGEGLMPGASPKMAQYDIEKTQAEAFERYEDLLNNQGVARELARGVLPMGTYTEFYWKIDLHNLLHFIQLRHSDHAQFEIQQYAQQLAFIVEAVAPLSWEAFVEYRLLAVSFSRTEALMLAELLAELETMGENMHEDLLENTRKMKEKLAGIHQFLV